LRLWTLHPRYLDPQGLVALWREGLLARAVLAGRTRGYRHHPQLRRFQAQAAPLAAIDAYLLAVHQEASARGYHFDRSKLGRARKQKAIASTQGQLDYEWQHLLAKLRARSPNLHRQWRVLAAPEAHPLFRMMAGGVEDWEKT
jgi:pyrimidine dimer DNA glycosylase